MQEEINRKIKAIYENIEEVIISQTNKFIPGKTLITTGLAVTDYNEINAVIKSMLNGWLGLDKKGREFENQFSKYLNIKYSVFVNSGSSANLLLLDSIKKLYNLGGGEVITPALTFPTTVNPIIQLGFKPALIDIDETINISLKSIEKAFNKNTCGILVPHIMGSPAKIKEISGFADKHNLFLLEDCCQALGSKYNNRMCGTFGAASTFSFYPSHKITTGEGGMISTDNIELYKILISRRDWGRMAAEENKSIDKNLEERFDIQLDNTNYDTKYIYTEIGYNLKPLELQAAIGLEQLKKINIFNEKRLKNYNLFKEKFEMFKHVFKVPKIHPEAEPCFFGFPVIIMSTKIDRRELLIFLNKHKIETRLFFAGNITKQPAYKNVDFAVYEALNNTNNITRQGFWLGIHPGITEKMIDYVIEVLDEFLKGI